MVENNTDNQSTDNQNTDNTQQNNTNGCVYDKWGRTPNKDRICAIGIKSASADTQSGVVKCVFTNKCPHCGNASLMWGWKWENDPEKVEKFDGTDGTAEGHIYCVQSEGGCDADYSIEGNEHINGSQYKLTVISGPTSSSEEEAQLLSNGQMACDGSVASGSPTTTAGGSAILIPDKTFYGLIKQMLGSIDGVFIIANNMAYLLSFQQLLYYRDQYEDYILELKPSDIITDSIIRNWTTDGLYNTVEVTYAEGIIKLQHDALVEVYGESVFHYNFPEDDAETAKAKADALLSAHVRDYSLDLQLNCIYNPNINVGSWIKIPKTLTKVSGSTSKTGGETLAAKKDEPKTYKGANITNLNEVLQKINDETKTVQKITTDDGKKYEVEIEKKDYEIYFVQAYKLKWTPNQAPIMSLHLKYGPDTPEDPINATVGTGGVAVGGASGGAFGSDCFTIIELCVENNEILMPKYMGGDRAEELKGMLNSGQVKITEDNKKGRADKNSSYAQKLSGKTPQEAYSMFRTEYDYSLYCNNCNCWKCAGDFYDKAGKAANCGDTACLLKVFFDVTGTPCIGVHIGGHYFNAIQLNGSWEIIDGVRIDNQTCNFPDGSTGYNWESPCPCEIYGSGDCNTC